MRTAQASSTAINDPSAPSYKGGGTFAEASENNGTVVGYFFDAKGAAHGFVDDSGRFTTLTDPAAGRDASEGTYLEGIPFSSCPAVN